MKKLFCLFFLLLLLGGCQAELPVVEDVPTKEKTTATDTIVPSAEDDAAAPEVLPHGRVETTYFTVELPKSWRETVTVDIGEDIENIYDVSFYEKINFETEGAGHLFTIRIIPEGEDYSFYPSYDVLGSLISVDGTSCHAVALYPTDVQAVVEMEAYFQLFEQIPEVLGAVTWKEAFGFVPQK